MHIANTPHRGRSPKKRATKKCQPKGARKNRWDKLVQCG